MKLTRRQFTKQGLLWLAGGPAILKARAQDVVPLRHKGAPNGLLSSLIHYYQLQESAAPFVDSVGGGTLNYTNSGADFSRVAGHVQAFASHYIGGGGFGAISTIVGAGFEWTGNGNASVISMSYLCWANYTSASSAFAPLMSDWCSTVPTESFLLRRDAANTLGLYIMNNSGVTVSIGSQTANDNVWHMIVFGFDATNLVIWISIDNGAKVTAPCATMRSQNACAVDFFNWGAGGNELAGAMSDCAVWNNRALSAADIAALWNGGAGLPFSKFTN